MKIGFPRVGDLTPRISGFLKELGLDVVDPPPITEKTIQLGVRHSPEMMCFPYKVTLGSMIELVDAGADILLQFTAGSETLCRQKQYYRLQSYRLARLGYQCKVVGVSPRTFVRDMATLSGWSRWRVRKAVVRWLQHIQQAEASGQQWAYYQPNIGIIGEVYCCIEPGVNRGLYKLIVRHGGNPYSTVTVSDYLRSEGDRTSWFGMLRRIIRPDPHERLAATYFEGMCAGHGEANIANLLRLIDRGIDGVIHVLPLTCMPESTIEEYVDGICEDNDVPLLRLPLDETNSPANVETRVETFVKLIARRLLCT